MPLAFDTLLAMATRHGLAGQQGKKQAKKRGLRMMMTLSAVGLFGLVLLGFLAGFFWREYGPWGASGVITLVGLVLVYVLRRTDKYLEASARERIKYLRGAQGEAVIAWLLDDLEDEWHVFNNIQLESASDIDHVVVGPAG